MDTEHGQARINFIYRGLDLPFGSLSEFFAINEYARQKQNSLLMAKVSCAGEEAGEALKELRDSLFREIQDSNKDFAVMSERTFKNIKDKKFIIKDIGKPM